MLKPSKQPKPNITKGDSMPKMPKYKLFPEAMKEMGRYTTKDRRRMGLEDWETMFNIWKPRKK